MTFHELAKKRFSVRSYSGRAVEDEVLNYVLECARMAPSAVNRQPWRIIAEGGRFHFYEKPDKGYVREQTGDLQKIDLGIALCHFVTGLEEQGKAPDLTVCDPGFPVPAEVEYIATVNAKER